MTNHGISYSQREMDTETSVKGTAMDGPTAERLFKANRLRDLIGVRSSAQPAEVKAACRQALLAHHPDKGGNGEVFKWVRPATEALLLEENLYAFDDGVPSWAKAELECLADRRKHISALAARLDTADARCGSLPSSQSKGSRKCSKIIDIPK